MARIVPVRSMAIPLAPAVEIQVCAPLVGSTDTMPPGIPLKASPPPATTRSVGARVSAVARVARGQVTRQRSTQGASRPEVFYPQHGEGWL